MRLAMQGVTLFAKRNRTARCFIYTATSVRIIARDQLQYNQNSALLCHGATQRQHLMYWLPS